MNTFIATSLSASIVIDGVSHQIRSTHPKFNKIVKAGAAADWAKVEKLLTKDPVTLERDGRVRVQDNGTVTVDGREVASVIADRVHAMVASGLSISSIARFIERLDDNPDGSVRERLYEFMDNSNIGISQDGRLGVYKRVREDFTDVHTGTFDNTPGQVVSMPRGEVDADHSVTCSRGLHVCSEGYLDSFLGQKVVLCMVDPKDVAAVPYDYNDSKMRVSKYEVVADITDNYTQGDLFSDSMKDGTLSGLVTSREPVEYEVSVSVDLGHKEVRFDTVVTATDSNSAGSAAIDSAYAEFGPMASYDVVSYREV